MTDQLAYFALGGTISMTGSADGVVVSQGTDTLEETAFLADLVWSRDAPLVLTGAMRNPTLPGADGPANLLAALQVAASDDARGQGALVVLADEIHADHGLDPRDTRGYPHRAVHHCWLAAARIAQKSRRPSAPSASAVTE